MDVFSVIVGIIGICGVIGGAIWALLTPQFKKKILPAPISVQDNSEKIAFRRTLAYFFSQAGTGAWAMCDELYIRFRVPNLLVDAARIDPDMFRELIALRKLKTPCNNNQEQQVLQFAKIQDLLDEVL